MKQQISSVTFSETLSRKHC